MWSWTTPLRRIAGMDSYKRARGLPLLALPLALVLSASACAPIGSRGGASSAAVRSPAPSPSATPVPCDPATQWKPPADNVSLQSFSMVSATEGWATGAQGSGSSIGSSSTAVLYHLLNGQWRRLPQTYPGAYLSTLSMDSPSDGWAASPYPVAGGGDHPLVLHDAGGVWRPVDVPALDAVLRPTATTSGANIMTLSVQMFGPHAGWMFAWTNRDSNNEGGPKSLVLRYLNDQWTLIPGPPVAPSVTLFDLSAVSADEAWMVGTDYTSSGQTTIFFHYSHGGWSVAPQTFPFVTESLTMLSATDGWAGDGGSGDGLLHYDGARWARFTPPVAWATQGITATGAAFAIAPGVDWIVTQRRDMLNAEQGPYGLSIWQDANGRWSQVVWPYQDSAPLALAVGAAENVWGIADIIHLRGCPPLMVTWTSQGVFLHESNGQWTRQVAP